MRPSSNAASDTLSEISEASTTGTERGSCYSSDYRDELQDLATSLGLNSSDDLHKVRFRVDRKKLENMLLGKNLHFNRQTIWLKIPNVVKYFSMIEFLVRILGKLECANSAQEFFEKVSIRIAKCNLQGFKINHFNRIFRY